MKNIEERQAIKRVNNEISNEYYIMRMYLTNLQRNISDTIISDDVKKKLDDLFKKHLDDVKNGRPDSTTEKIRNRK